MKNFILIVSLVFTWMPLSAQEVAREAARETAQTPQQLHVSEGIQQVSDENIFADSLYHNWCSSIIKGEDGLYHLVYARWKREYTFYAWLTHSTIAHAVAEKPEGPYRYVNTLIDFEEENIDAGEFITAHNPKIKYFDGKYYLYFISTKLDRPISNQELIETAQTGYSHPNWGPMRVNQRTYVASSKSLDKPFKIRKKPLIEPSGPITTLTVNPAIAQGADKKYYLIVKGDKPGSTKFERNQALAISSHPDRGFVMQDKAVIKDWDTEDMSLLYDENTKHFYAIFHAHTYVGMMASKDGINWKKSENFTIMEMEIKRIDGLNSIKPQRMERPFLYVEDGEPRVLALAVKIDDDARIVFIPIKN